MGNYLWMLQISSAHSIINFHKFGNFFQNKVTKHRSTRLSPSRLNMFSICSSESHLTLKHYSGGIYRFVNAPNLSIILRTQFICYTFSCQFYTFIILLINFGIPWNVFIQLKFCLTMCPPIKSICNAIWTASDVCPQKSVIVVLLKIRSLSQFRDIEKGLFKPFSLLAIVFFSSVDHSIASSILSSLLLFLNGHNEKNSVQMSVRFKHVNDQSNATALFVTVNCHLFKHIRNSFFFCVCVFVSVSFTLAACFRRAAQIFFPLKSTENCSMHCLR